ncbi:MAG: hypothetical protein AAFO79_10115 [Pseudomonadota bacterium]
MPYRLLVTAVYSADIDDLFARARSFDELKAAMAGFATYEGIPAGAQAEEGATYVVDATLFGWYKVRGHTFHVERVDLAQRRIQSREHQPGVRRWDHCLTIAQGGHPEEAVWTDDVIIEAGWQSSAIAHMANRIYRHRHHVRSANQLASQVRYARSDAV